MKTKLGGETGNLFLKIKLKKETGKLVAEKQNSKKENLAAHNMGFMKLGFLGLTLKIVLYFYGQWLTKSSGI